MYFGARDIVCAVVTGSGGGFVRKGGGYDA